MTTSSSSKVGEFEGFKFVGPPPKNWVYVDPETGPADSEPVLQEAHRLITKDRNEAYGPFEEDYARAVAIFNAWTGHSLSVSDGIRFMIAVKMSRQEHEPSTRDNYVDAPGYWAGLARVEGVER